MNDSISDSMNGKMNAPSFPDHPLRRREFLLSLAGGTAALMGCVGGESITGQTGGGNARLTARPGTPGTISPAGIYPITASNPNDGALIVPDGVPGTPRPLVVALHGAGQGADWGQNMLGAAAAARGFLLLSPGARGITWDVMTYRYSYDVTFLNSALAWTFAQCNVDSTRIILLGFSDGASYALGLGEANGDLFTRVVACSPGYEPRSDSPATGKPSFFVSHGTQDQVLNIDNASRVIVPRLRARGYSVGFVEFDGGHSIPPGILTQALDFALA